MALDRIYRLTCDGWSLIDLNRKLSDSSRRAVNMACHGRSPIAPTSTKARTVAKANGWARHKEDVLTNPNHPSAGTSVHRFDLCPSCAKALIES